MRYFLIITAAIAMSACGPDKSNEAAKATNGSSDSGSISKSDQKAGSAALTSTPISFADALGDTAEMIEVGPCPFLSDEAILASVRTNFEVTRREVSNSLCRWAYNRGFAIEVTIEDLQQARPIAERKYNIGVDTILEPQDGPGENAAILNDTAWDKPIPFAYSFEKDGKLVFIRNTGFKLNVTNLRAAADEVAARMATAPTIEPQRRSMTEPFKACETWNEQDLRAVFDVADTAVVARGMKGQTTCYWDIYVEGVSGKKSAGFNFYRPEAGNKPIYEKLDYASYANEGETHYISKNDSGYGLSIHIVTPRPEGFVNTTVTDPEKDSTSVAKALHKNLLSRLGP